MNPTDELVKAAEALMDANSYWWQEVDPAIVDTLHNTIGPAKAYAERMGEAVEALRELLRLKLIKEDMEAGNHLEASDYNLNKEKAWNAAKALLASLDAPSGTAAVGPNTANLGESTHEQR